MLIQYKQHANKRDGRVCQSLCESNVNSFLTFMTAIQGFYHFFLICSLHIKYITVVTTLLLYSFAMGPPILKHTVIRQESCNFDVTGRTGKH